MVNTTKLKETIEQVGIPSTKLAEAIGRTRATFYKKLDKGNFTCQEALNLSKALRLTDDEFVSIFLA